MDKGSALGLSIAAAGILGGLMLDGGNIGQILQPTAAMIVLGGTTGAVLLQFPSRVVMQSLRHAKDVILHRDADVPKLIERICGLANKARKQGIVSLDKELDGIPEPFLRKAVMLAVDGVQPTELRKSMEFELDIQTEQSERCAQVFDAAGGFAPTIGIIGAILGLIQVMQHLNNINEVGRGIAVAFVATVYGVATANLGFLPLAGKLRVRRREADLLHEMMLEGVISILEGVNPRMLQMKLGAYLPEAKPAGAGAKAAAEPAGQPEPAST